MIATFSEIAKTEINELDDLVFAYSLYVAIILKNDTPAYKFLMSDKSSINFEWFLDLRSIYLARLKPVDIFVFDTAYSSIKIPKTYSESSEYVNNQTIELA